ncbi:MAG: methylenetetrahydrofolate reductase [Bacteroidales bacterium]|jgi:methylenetetrahydrofolate reductase (NADPH)|nr:methylenetetrahydrofolate reductase [Bacteroidales bacterium]
MKVIDILKKNKEPFASFEIVPPLKGSDIYKLYQYIEPLMEFAPPFINITCHRDEVVFYPDGDGVFRKVLINKRPGTVAIAAAILKRFQVEVVPHLICGGASVQKLENDLMDLHFLEIHNVVALRGDPMPGQKYFAPEPDGFKHSYELVSLIRDMNTGHHSDRELSHVCTDFCVGVAGYPEKHFEAPNIETDIINLKAKVDAGADYIITQMFFDNQKFYHFEKKCREAGILVPVIPGLKPLSTIKQSELLPKSFHLDLPEDLMRLLRCCSTPEAVYEAGVEWCVAQSKDLLQHGVPAIHYYTMGKANNVKQVIKNVF